MTRMTRLDYAVMRNLINTYTHRLHVEGDLGQEPVMRGGCTPCPIRALVRPPSAPWDQAPGGPPEPGKQYQEVSDGKVEESTE